MCIREIYKSADDTEFPLEYTFQPATFRMQAGYDHSYFFVASFMRDHIDFHAEALRA